MLELKKIHVFDCNMRILVTGANGLVGKKITRQLLSGGKHEVYATSLKKLQIPGAVTFTSNLLNADINFMVDETHPDVIIHCAALSSPDACEVDRFACKRLNVDLTARIAMACNDYGVQLILMSTDFVFDGLKGQYAEEDRANPICYYGMSKAEAEQEVASMSAPWAIARTSLVFGYEQRLSRSNIVLRVAENLIKGNPFRVAFDQIRTPTLAEDLARGIEAIATNRATGIFHLAGSEIISVADLAARTAEVFGLNPELLLPVSTEMLTEPARRPLNTSLCCHKAIEQLGYSPKGLTEALRLVYSQMKLDGYNP